MIRGAFDPLKFWMVVVIMQEEERQKLYLEIRTFSAAPNKYLRHVSSFSKPIFSLKVFAVGYGLIRG